jgi:hypothetical protein
MKRFGSAAWNCGLREGKGSVSTESRARSLAATVKSRAPIRRSYLGRLMPPVSRLRALSASTQSEHSNPWRLKMPVVTFTVRRGLSAADKSRLSEAMLEAQVTAGYHRADRSRSTGMTSW